jgi:hypothetical protein
MTTPFDLSYIDRSPIQSEWRIVFAFEMEDQLNKNLKRRTKRSWHQNLLGRPTQVCSECGIPLSRSKFHRDSHMRDGIKARCKECIKDSRNLDGERILQKKYRQNKKYGITEKKKPFFRTFKREDREGYLTWLWESQANNWVDKAIKRCVERARKKKVPFAMQKNDLLPIPKFCPVIGIELDYQSGPLRQSWASIDRVRPHLGYVTGNVRIISMAANSAKMDGVLDFITPRKPKVSNKNLSQLLLFDGDL